MSCQADKGYRVHFIFYRKVNQAQLNLNNHFEISFC